MAEPRNTPGMRVRSLGTWEQVVGSGRDPFPGKRRKVSRIFRGAMRDSDKARAALLVEISKGHHAGAGAMVDDRFQDWIVELRRKGRSPNTIHG